MNLENSRELNGDNFYEKLQIESFKNAISDNIKIVIYSSTEGKTNPFYYLTHIDDFEKTINRSLKENKNYYEFYDLLEKFNHIVINCLKDTTCLFIEYYKYDKIKSNDIDGIITKRAQVNYHINEIKSIKLSIRKLVGEERNDSARKIKNYCIPLIEQIEIKLNFFNIQFEKSPLKKYFKNIIKDIEKIYIGKAVETVSKREKDYKNFIWFNTGVTLATGEAFILYKKYKNDKGHFKKICEELGFKKSDRPYFSATLQDNKTDKNTFADKNKLQKLHNHLKENNLKFGEEFLKKYNQIEFE